MTQHAQDAPETHVPKWFADFAVKNADEHAALAKSIADSHAALAKEVANNAKEIADVRGDLAKSIADVRKEIAQVEARLTRWTAILVIGGLTIAVAIILNFN